MSFGFGVGDFLAVTELSWKLYRYCYKVAQGAPQEFQLLLKEITVLSQCIKLLEEEVQDPNSTLLRAGEDRVRMVKEMIGRVEITLKELEKHAKKFEKLGDPSRSRGRKIWVKFKWSVDAPELDSLRNKLVYHNGVIRLLLTSVGNSSLQRIESSALKLERRVSEIKDLIRKSDTKNTSSPCAPPVVSAVNASDRVFQLSLSAELLRNAQVSRPWPSIGVDEWIQAGRWWLLKSQSELYKIASLGCTVNQGYTDLIKASWILVDIIAQHPQLNFLDSGVQIEVELLAETLKNEFQSIESLGLVQPSFQDLANYDLRIWETHARAATLQPGGGKFDLENSQAKYSSWMTIDERVYFQRFVHYQSNPHANRTPCIVLLLVHKKEKMAQITLRDQNWATLATFIVGKIDAQPVGKSSVQIGDQTIELPTPEDAQLLSVITEAVEEYIFYSKRNDKEHETLQALTLLFAVKNYYPKVVERLLEDEKSLASKSCSSDANVSSKLWHAANKLASGFISRQPPRVYNNESLLRWAIQNEHGTITEVLLEVKGVIIGDRDFRICRDLDTAAGGGHEDIVSLLLNEKGVEIGKVIDGRTALQVAAGGGHEAIVDTLLKAGADVNAEAGLDGGRTALQAAAEGGHEAIVDTLLVAGADVNAQAGYHGGRTALQAAAGGHKAIVNTLLKAGADINATPSKLDGRTALQAAAGGGHEAIVDILLVAGADVNAEAGFDGGRTALQAAAEGGHEAIVDTLLKASADVNAEAGRHGGRTAFQAAAGGGHEAIVDILLVAGADVNAEAGFEGGRTTLQAAAGGGHEAIVNTLLVAGADVNAKAGYRGGRTALQAAAEEGHEAIVDTLLVAGADINAEAGNIQGRTALQAAAGGGHEAIVNTLLEAGADINTTPSRLDGRTALQAAAGGRHEAIVDILLKAGADVNSLAGDYGGRTALQAAAGGGHEATVNTLLKAGADVNSPAGDYGGRTALQAAAEGGHKAIVDMLRKAGAN